MVSTEERSAVVDARRLEQHLQHGRHDVQRRRPPALDRLEIGGGREARQDRRRPAAQPVRQDEGAAGMDHRGGVEHDLAGRRVDQVGQHIVDDRRIGRLGMLRRLQRAAGARGEQGKEHIVRLGGQARIGVRRSSARRSRSGPTGRRRRHRAASSGSAALQRRRPLRLARPVDQGPRADLSIICRCSSQRQPAVQRRALQPRLHAAEIAGMPSRPLSRAGERAALAEAEPAAEHLRDPVGEAVDLPKVSASSPKRTAVRSHATARRGGSVR